MFVSRSFALLAFAALVFTGGAAIGAASPQSGAKKRNAPPPAKVAKPSEPKKATSRPEGASGTNGADAASSSKDGDARAANKENPDAARFTYEFRQPDFFVHFIRIEHDERGRGRISFERRSDVELLTEPFQLSPAALERIAAHWSALDFLNSKANYQSERNMSHLGKTRLKMSREGRERAAEFSYSTTPEAQALADEYRRAAEQALLVFEMSVALEGQPLEMPKLINRLDSLVQRNALSDASQLVPLLRNLIEDERVPLVGRNHAERILKKLEKK